MSASDPDPQLYSTITVEQVEYTDDDLAPLKNPAESDSGFPEPPLPPLVDPDDLRNSETPAFIVAVHAVDPSIGSGTSDDFSSVIGFRILEKGTYTESFEVPIFPFTIVNNETEELFLEPEERTPSGETYPPNPDGDTEVQGRLWGVKREPIPDSGEKTRSFGPLNESGGDPATITNLDQNPSFLPIGEGSAPDERDFERSVLTPETFDSTDVPAFGASVDIGGAAEETVAVTVRTEVRIESSPGAFQIGTFEEFGPENTIAAGAPGEDHSTNTGSTYVLNGIFEELEPGNAGLTGDSVPDDGAEFGTAVAYDIDRIPDPHPIELLAVGAPGDDDGSGAVYVFKRQGGSWNLEEKLTGPGGEYGAAVDVLVDEDLGQFVLIGAPAANDEKGEAELVTLKEPTEQTTVPTINKPDGLGKGANFGLSVALPEFIPIVGAPGANSNMGAAYFGFRLEEGPINLADEVQEAPSSGDVFGAAVGSTVPFESLVGAPGTDNRAGAIYQFVPEDEENPAFSATQLPADAEVTGSGDALGASVAGSESGRFLAGASDGRYAALFELPETDGGTFPEYQFAGKFELPDIPSFGASVAISPEGSRGVIGAPEANGGDGAAFLVDISEDGGGGVNPL